IIITNLRIHHPEILLKYNISTENICIQTNSKIYIAIPFYKNILNIRNLFKEFLLRNLEQCEASNLKNLIQKINLNVAFKQPNSLKRIIRKNNTSSIST